MENTAPGFGDQADVRPGKKLWRKQAFPWDEEPGLPQAWDAGKMNKKTHHQMMLEDSRKEY